MSGLYSAYATTKRRLDNVWSMLGKTSGEMSESQLKRLLAEWDELRAAEAELTRAATDTLCERCPMRLLKKYDVLITKTVYGEEE